MPSKQKMNPAVLGTLLAATLLTLWGCEGSATQTTNGGLREGELGGILVDLAGNPVADAKVQVWAAGSISAGVPGNPGGDPPEAVTDKQGRYKVMDLVRGQYNVFGIQGKGLATVFIPAINLTDSGLDLGVDTLKPPGKIVGKTYTAEGPLEGVFCYLPGSSYISISDEDGSFALDNVPEGVYRLKYAAAGYTTVTDTIEVVSGEAMILPPQLIGPDLAAQPPIPQGLRATYDTVRGVITFRWKPVKLADLGDYVLYTQELGNDPVMRGSLGMDSVYVDSAFRTIFLPDMPLAGRDSGSLVFLIKARDKEGNLSRLYSDPFALPMTRPQVYQGGFTINPIGVGDSATCRDTLDLRVGFNSPLRDPFAVAMMAMRKIEVRTYVSVYDEKTGAMTPGDTAAFLWYHGKGDITNYPDRETFYRSTFKIELFLYGPAGWFQMQYVEVTTDGNGCLRPKPARLQ